MVEFANAVFGEAVDWKAAEHHTLAFSRGNNGFFAMGDLGQEYETGLPDGEYCDIISECKQKITV
jgi:alpha-amylase